MQHTTPMGRKPDNRGLPPEQVLLIQGKAVTDRCYEEGLRGGWETTHPGEYVVIVGTNVIGFASTQNELATLVDTATKRANQNHEPGPMVYRIPVKEQA